MLFTDFGCFQMDFGHFRTDFEHLKNIQNIFATVRAVAMSYRATRPRPRRGRRRCRCRRRGLRRDRGEHQMTTANVE